MHAHSQQRTRTRQTHARTHARAWQRVDDSSVCQHECLHVRAACACSAASERNMGGERQLMCAVTRRVPSRLRVLESSHLAGPVRDRVRKAAVVIHRAHDLLALHGCACVCARTRHHIERPGCGLYHLFLHAVGETRAAILCQAKKIHAVPFLHSSQAPVPPRVPLRSRRSRGTRGNPPRRTPAPCARRQCPRRP